MSKKNLGTIEDFADLGDVGGEVDLFGLDEFGEIPADAVSPLWGAVIAGGFSTGAAIAVRALSAPGKWHKYSEGIGFLVGATASGIMFAFGKKARHAGVVGLATTFLTSGLRQLERLFSSSDLYGNLGVVMPEMVNTLGVVTPEQINAFGQFGVVTPEEVPAFGMIMPEQIQVPVAGTQFGSDVPVDVLNASALPPSAEHVGVMGGPPMSGLGTFYGATLFGGGNN